MNLRGHLDVVLSSGFINGWACDDDRPLQPLTIAVLSGGAEIAFAIANIYRPDLADAGCGTGWCAFRGRLAVAVSQIRGVPLSLHEVSTGQILHSVQALPELDMPDLTANSVADIIAQDPTLLGDTSCLKGCGRVLDAFIRQRGVEDFVSTAFIYVLNRPGDHSALGAYANLVRQGLLEPLNMLRELADSAEYRAKPNAMVAPCHPSFPFQDN
ncbi:MAG: hypothetical protein P4K98_02285 [Bryobacteraceae bacterium]|nr:hypothetical protein [Bryobacteraceae bacterium]